jgi:hypothetical protein
MAQSDRTQAAKTMPTDASGNASEGLNSTPKTLLEPERSSTAKPVAIDRVERPSMRRATGPRTPQGKARSKLNALKQGLFSKAVLLESESPAEYESLLNALREGLQPHGELEEVLVEKLATILWRERRLLQAEAAEIEKATTLNLDRMVQQEADELEYAQLKEAPDRKLTHSSNLTVFRNAIEILNIVRGMQEDDSQAEKAGKLFRAIYGCEKDGAPPFGPRQLYFALWKLLSAPQEVKCTKDSIDLTEFKRKAIEKEMLRLAELLGIAASVEKLKRKQDVAIARVPSPEVSDRLLRVEAHLSREFDRTLSQLERLQRFRKGQPAPPRLDVHIS